MAMNRIWYRILWAFEVVLILVIALILAIPIMDYGQREHMAWFLHPSAETLKAWQEKRREEFRVRLSTAAPIATAALLLAFPLFRLRSKTKKSA
jgi:hypothetical protein